MSDVVVPPSAGQEKKPESRRSIIIVAVICASFLWWWFTLDPAPEEVGPLGLVQRALHEELQENTAKPTARPLAVDFDLLELAMNFLRAGKFNEATNLAVEVHAPILQARGLRAVAFGHLAKDTGGMGAALEVLKRIADPALQQTSREQILVDVTRMGFPDVAWEQQPSMALKVAIVRNMAESDAQTEAAQRLLLVEPEVLAQPTPAMLEELLWAHVALQHVDRVFELLPKLPEAAQDDLYLDLFRMVRLKDAALAKPTLERLPERLHLRARLEAVKLSGTLDKPEQLLAELEAKFQAEPTVAKALLLTQAQYQLEKPEPQTWITTAQQLEKLLATAPAEQRIVTALTLSQIYYDALDGTNGHRLLESGRQLTAALPDVMARLPHLASLLEAAFRNGETNYVQQLVRDLEPDLQALNASTPIALLPALRQVCVAMFREGEWVSVLDLLAKFSAPMQAGVLTALADLPVESSAGQGFAISQDRSLALFRQVATSQGEVEAAKLALRQPTGTARARAWLEIAKGLVLKQVIDSELTIPPVAPAPGP